MKKQPLLISIIILIAIMVAGVWLVENKKAQEWVAVDTTQYDDLIEKQDKPFVPHFQLASELESNGYKYFPHLSLSSKEMSIYAYVRNNDPQWEVKEAALYILDGENENRALTTDRQIFDNLTIKTSTYCSNPACVNENPVVETNACRTKNDFQRAYVVNERGNSEMKDGSEKIYAAWIIESSKFVPVSDLSSIECNYLED